MVDLFFAVCWIWTNSQLQNTHGNESVPADACTCWRLCRLAFAHQRLSERITEHLLNQIEHVDIVVVFCITKNNL